MRVAGLSFHGAGLSNGTDLLAQQKTEKTELLRQAGKEVARNADDLDAAQRAEVARLQARDTQVRSHEAAHLAAAGGIATGGASYTYQEGPDKRQYAVGGEVPIAVSPGKDPEETVRKMRQVAAAAMAPADPSPQDYAVAASARAEELKALQELRKLQNESAKQEGLKVYETAARDAAGA
ncbi:MAG: hypothetical protein GXO33_03065 [Epsilonproteobacteria bacterium]|nr:hypothetical protein [Campylobacterota bacterium]